MQRTCCCLQHHILQPLLTPLLVCLGTCLRTAHSLRVLAIAVIDYAIQVFILVNHLVQSLRENVVVFGRNRDREFPPTLWARGGLEVAFVPHSSFLFTFLIPLSIREGFTPT